MIYRSNFDLVKFLLKWTKDNKFVWKELDPKSIQDHIEKNEQLIIDNKGHWKIKMKLFSIKCNYI